MSGPNNSSVAGFLTPNPAPAPLEDKALDDFFQALVVGITGLATANVRPRWQAEPPTQPEREDDWMAVGVVDEDPDTYAVVRHSQSDDPDAPIDELQRHEDLDVLVSSYGPNARGNLKILADGLLIPQNLAVLTANGMGLVEASRIVAAPDLVKEKWLRRFDLHIIVRRNVTRTYNILNIDSASGEITTGQYTDEFDVNPPVSP